MDIRPLDEALSASPQIAPEDLPAIAAQGFRSVISNRPDGEEPGQPSAEDLRQAAEAAGLAFRPCPRGRRRHLRPGRGGLPRGSG
jgi:uncharacterized protein (TIGR01244 family)